MTAGSGRIFSRLVCARVSTSTATRLAAMDSKVQPLILITAASLVQCRLGSTSPSARPISALSSTNSSASSRVRQKYTGGICTAACMHTRHNAAGTPVSSRCSSSLAHRACQDGMGRLCRSQTVRPSSETEGVVRKLAADTAHTAQHTSTGTPSGTACANRAKKSAFHRDTPPSTSRPSVPMALLSI